MRNTWFACNVVRMARLLLLMVRSHPDRRDRAAGGLAMRRGHGRGADCDDTVPYSDVAGEGPALTLPWLPAFLAPARDGVLRLQRTRSRRRACDECDRIEAAQRRAARLRHESCRARAAHRAGRGVSRRSSLPL